MTSPCASVRAAPLSSHFGAAVALHHRMTSGSAELHWFRLTSVWSDTSAEPLQTPTTSVKREQSRTGGKCCGSPAPGPAERLRLIDKQRKEDTADKRHLHVSLKITLNCLELFGNCMRLLSIRDPHSPTPYRSIGCVWLQRSHVEHTSLSFLWNQT